MFTSETKVEQRDAVGFYCQHSFLRKLLSNSFCGVFLFMVSTSLSSVKSSFNSLASFLAYVFVRLNMTHFHLIFILEGDLNQQQFALFSMI